MRLRQGFLAACALSAIGLWSPSASAYYTVDSIDYTLQWEMLSGYAETSKDFFDWHSDTQCVYYVMDDWGVYCYMYFIQENWVSAEADVWDPDGGIYYDGGPELGFLSVLAAWGPDTITSFHVGDWTHRGQHHIEQFYVWLVCPYSFCYPVAGGSSSYDLGYEYKQANVCTYSLALMDQVMAGILNTFPQEPWERGFAALCLEPSLTVFNFTDSFGEIYGYNPTGIACAVYPEPPSPSIPAQAHKHPYITTVAQFNRDLGCFYPDPPLAYEPGIEFWMFWMQTSGASFSTSDINYVRASGKREYLRSSLGDLVLRRDYNDNEVQVYP